jgi:hypothetical protein
VREKDTLKIGFIGAGGTGKSTLAAKLDIPFVPSVMRSVLAEHSVVEKSFDDIESTAQRKTIWEIQKAGFDRKVQQDLSPHGVFDRTLLDHYGYCLLHAAAAIPNSVAMSMEQLVRINLKHYDHIFYVPLPAWIPVPDGVRIDRLSHRYATDALFLGLLERTGVPYWTVDNSLPAEEMAKHLMAQFFPKYIRAGA